MWSCLSITGNSAKWEAKARRATALAGLGTTHAPRSDPRWKNVTNRFPVQRPEPSMQGSVTVRALLLDLNTQPARIATAVAERHNVRPLLDEGLL
jgi:hypothetical protein